MNYKIKLLSISIIVSIMCILSCTDSDTTSKTDFSTQSRNPKSEDFNLFIDKNIWGTKKVESEKIDKNLKKVHLEFVNNEKRTFYVSTSIENEVTIYEVENKKRSITLNSDTGHTLVSEDGREVSFNDSFTDIIIGLVAISDNPNYFDLPVQIDSCIHTYISIRARKSVTLEKIRKFLDDYLGAHKDCKQIGDIDTWCLVGDFGCFSATEIECEKTGC